MLLVQSAASTNVSLQMYVRWLRHIHAYIFAQCCSSLDSPLFMPCIFLCIVYSLSRSLSLSPSQILLLKHARALLSSKRSVAYKLAAVSSQALCVGRGRMGKLSWLQRTNLNQALLDWVILDWGCFVFKKLANLHGISVYQTALKQNYFRSAQLSISVDLGECVCWPGEKELE